MNRAIIVAAGKGLRMKADRRKQFLHLGGRPILTHTLSAFDRCNAIDQLIVVIPGEEMDFCQKEILGPAGLEGRVALVEGGQRRQESVFNGIGAIDDNAGIVLIHDGVRPLVSIDMIEACIQGAKEWGGCIPAIFPVDTLKQVDGAGSVTQTIDRQNIRLAQTPQAFQLSIIRKAHQMAVKEGWVATDDASLVEQMGGVVRTIRGSRENLKITTAQDMALAELFLSRRLSGENGF